MEEIKQSFTKFCKKVTDLEIEIVLEQNGTEGAGVVELDKFKEIFGVE
jgi:hypothetical protein